METTSEKPHTCGSDEEGGENIPFSQAVSSARDVTGYTVAEMAILTHTPHRTIESWIAGMRVPSDVKQVIFLTTLLSKDAPPSKRKIAIMRDQHNLTWDASKRRWKMRLTIETGKKTVGMRKSAHIPATECHIAAMVRDLTASCLKQFGLTVRPRIQKRRSQP